MTTDFARAIAAYAVLWTLSTILLGMDKRGVPRKIVATLCLLAWGTFWFYCAALAWTAAVWVWRNLG